MVNFNGDLQNTATNFLNHQNRAFKFGDALFETIRIVNGKLFFWEDHYFRLMASMRILRMEIPMQFTLEFLEEELIKTIHANNLAQAPARARLTVYRSGGGLYAPTSNDVAYVIEVSEIDTPFYTIDEKPYIIELYKDHYINADMLSNLKSTNKIINVVASVFAKENGYDNCVLLNGAKQVVETINGNLFLVTGNTIKTPPLKDGCLNGILRKKLIEVVQKLEGLDLVEDSISSFELQKADELFITNVIMGIRPITKYRKKEYGNTVARNLLGKLNAQARLA